MKIRTSFFIQSTPPAEREPEDARGIGLNLIAFQSLVECPRLRAALRPDKWRLNHGGLGDRQ